MIKMLERLCLVWVLVALQSCAGTEVGNPADSEDIQLALRGYDGAKQGALVLGNGDSVEEAWLLLERVELRRAERCGGESGEEEENEDTIQGPFAVELVAGQALPVMPMFKTQSQAFCLVELELGALESDETLPAGAPPELQGASVLLRGVRGDGEPFMVVAAVDASLRIEARDQVFSLTDDNHALLLGFALNVLLDGARDVRPSPDGIIRIDDDTDPKQREAFERALRESATLFRDHNRDGAFGDDDLQSPLGDGQP